VSWPRVPRSAFIITNGSNHVAQHKIRTFPECPLAQATHAYDLGLGLFSFLSFTCGREGPNSLGCQESAVSFT